MRFTEFKILLEKTEDVSALKGKIIDTVNRTDDAELLDKIYTVLNKTNLAERIGLVLKRDTDARAHVQDIVEMIINVPGTYEEKWAFVEGYPNGYVDIDYMLSGEHVKFEQLLTGAEDAPIAFINRVFLALKQVTFGSSKGPGEFALAVLSPHIIINGKGDLNIGDKVYEVKASAGKEVSSGGGRLGTPGLLNATGVSKIIKKYSGQDFAGKTLRLTDFSAVMATVDPAQKQEFAEELFGHIFADKADISGLVAAAVSNGDLSNEYLKANYQAYQEESHFDGLILINFAAGMLKHYVDPESMNGEIYSTNVQLCSAEKAHEQRQIISQVTLKKPVEPKVQPPELEPGTAIDKADTVDFKQKIVNYANAMAQKHNITDSDVLDQIALITYHGVKKGLTTKQIEAKIKRTFPEYLKTRKVSQDTAQQAVRPAPAAAPAAPAPVATQQPAAPSPATV